MADKLEGTILIVDDMAENVTLLSRILANQGYTVQTADNGPQAIEIAQTSSPDLILLDINMPGMDGFETCVRLKQDERTRDIPVIFISALDSIEDKVKAFHSGGVDYIPKPFEYEEVRARVETHLAILRLRIQLQSANRELAALANQDPLTACFNRRHFMTLAENELQRAIRYKRPLSLVMLDIDQFKNFNDQYGHQIGDQVLCALVNLCQKKLRKIDVLGRYGGEEFVILLPETIADGGLQAAERLRQRIEKMKIASIKTKLLVTVSMGVASLDSDFNPAQTLDMLIKRADQALYAAKSAGRNCVRAG